jgi:hypothetical protein
MNNVAPAAIIAHPNSIKTLTSSHSIAEWSQDYSGRERENVSPTTLRVIKAFDPILDLIQGIAFPLTYLMVGVGACLVILGQKHKAMQIIKTAVIGFLLSQWLRGFMSIIAEVGRSLNTP